LSHFDHWAQNKGGDGMASGPQIFFPLIFLFITKKKLMIIADHICHNLIYYSYTF